VPDPLGLLNNLSGAQPSLPHAPGATRKSVADVDFKKVLHDQLQQVNNLQHDAHKAVEDLTTGRRDDLEGVILATQKAETAFKMLLSVRNKVMDAYEEVKQIRV
jgi:flagellar hook-basal body complex protein FliE